MNRTLSTTQHLTLGGLKLARELEPLHWLIVGSTGTGKSAAIEELLDGIVARGERVIVSDPNGGYWSRYAQHGDQLLNPFDCRSPGWQLFNELRRDYDADRLARSVVPDGLGENSAWHGYAQVLLAELLRTLLRRGETTSAQLLYWASSASATDLGALLAGTPAAGLCTPDAARALASTRFILTSHLAPQRHMPPGPFSLRSWLDDDTSASLYLTWRSDMQTALAPLLSAWVDILVCATLSLPPDPSRRFWLVLDELAALGQLQSLESALTLGRKHGLAVVAGLQSTAQLNRTYGPDSAIVLLSCFRNLLVLGIARSDPATREHLSLSLGERELIRSQSGRAIGSQGYSQNTHTVRERERLLLPSEIAELPDLHGVLALAGDGPITPIRIIPRDRPLVAAPYEEEPPC